MLSRSLNVGSRRIACGLLALLALAVARPPSAVASSPAGAPTPAGAPIPTGASSSAAAAMVALAPTPPMGWNPWYEFGCGVDEQLVEQTAQAIVSSGMAADGYHYVNLDDCWMAPERDANGNLQADPQTFPDGIAALASYVHELGLKLGIYLDAGTQTCMERPGSAAHFPQDVATLASWGVDYIKVDYCYTNFIPAQPVYAAMHQALLAAGRPIVLSVSDDAFDDPWRWAPKIASLWRTTNDYTAYGASTGNWWGAMLKIVDFNSGLYRFAHPGAWNDPDVLLTGTGLLTVPQERSQFSLWSMMAAPLLVDGDVRTMSAATASILTNREVIAVDQDRAGLQAVRISDRGGHQVWLRKLADGSHAVLFFNTDRRPGTIEMSASRAGLAGKRYTVRDLWRHRSWTSAATTIRAGVNSDDVVMLRLSVLRNRPARRQPS